MTMQIHFLFLERLDGYFFNPYRPEGLNFIDAEANVEIGIGAGGETQDHYYGHRNLEIWAKLSRNVTEQQTGLSKSCSISVLSNLIFLQ